MKPANLVVVNADVFAPGFDRSAPGYRPSLRWVPALLMSVGLAADGSAFVVSTDNTGRAAWIYRRHAHPWDVTGQFDGVAQ